MICRHEKAFAKAVDSSTAMAEVTHKTLNDTHRSKMGQPTE